MAITAKTMLRGRKIDNIPVVNPGDWWGRTWLLAVEMGYDASFFVVEADSLGDAIDEFSESEHGHLIHIEPEDLVDYDPESLHYDGKGQPYDTDHLYAWGREGYGRNGRPPHPVRYHGDGLPPEGIDPDRFVEWREENT